MARLHPPARPRRWAVATDCFPGQRRAPPSRCWHRVAAVAAAASRCGVKKKGINPPGQTFMPFPRLIQDDLYHVLDQMGALGFSVPGGISSDIEDVPQGGAVEVVYTQASLEGLHGQRGLHCQKACIANEDCQRGKGEEAPAPVSSLAALHCKGQAAAVDNLDVFKQMLAAGANSNS